MTATELAGTLASVMVSDILGKFCAMGSYLFKTRGIDELMSEKKKKRTTPWREKKKATNTG
jgi:hypothetical protein